LPHRKQSLAGALYQITISIAFLSKIYILNQIPGGPFMKIKQKYPDVDYGPLIWLIGEWKGDKGMDIAPNPETGKEENPYTETIMFEEAGNLKNAKDQEIAVVRYLQIVFRKSNGEVFHDQTGYWMWDAERQLIMHSLTIPRGFALLAGGKLSPENNTEKGFVIEVEASDGHADWGIVQSPFLRDNAKTEKFKMKLRVDEKNLTYFETTDLKIYSGDFEHTDEIALVRVK